MSGHYLYLVAYEKSGPIKIGYSSHPEERIKQLQTGSPQRLALLGVRDFENERFARFAEEMIHLTLDPWSASGGNEWFGIGVSTGESILKEFPFYDCLDGFAKFKRPHEYGEANHIADLADDEFYGEICSDLISHYYEVLPSEYHHLDPLEGIRLDWDTVGWEKVFPYEKLAYFE